MKNNELKEERMKILELLSKKIISAEEAEKLLSALNQDDSETKIEKKQQFKMLKIIIDSAGGDKVNVEIPIEFARLLKNKKLMGNYTDDIDLNIEDLIEMIQTGATGELVNIESADGDIIKIVVE